MPGVDGDEDQRMHLAAAPIANIGQHSQVAEIDLAFHPWVTISDPHRGVLAAVSVAMKKSSLVAK
jgi:hypothetical protein